VLATLADRALARPISTPSRASLHEPRSPRLYAHASVEPDARFEFTPLDGEARSVSPDAVTLEIRDAQPRDRDAIREVTLAAYAEYERVMSPGAWAGLKEAVRMGLEVWEGVEWIVALRSGSVAGSVVLYPPSSDAYRGATAVSPWPELRLLSVRPAERGRGVGRALVAECIRRAGRAGATAIGLHTSHSMTDAVRMYRALGFERAPDHDFQPPGAELVTAYRLAISAT
jgi:ribosomal protein S18 acetylase RimI-like enzyme